jgi:hypothetical protein
MRDTTIEPIIFRLDGSAAYGVSAYLFRRAGHETNGSGSEPIDMQANEFSHSNPQITENTRCVHWQY